MRTAIALAAVLALTGCAGFCERHSTGCAVTAVVATAIVVGSIEAHREQNAPASGLAIGTVKPPCTPQPNGMCR